MSNTPRQYLYTAEDVYGKDGLDDGMSRDEIWHAYEAERAKDAELIQMAVNACTDPHKMSLSRAFLSAAAAAGFTPSEP